MAAFLILGTFYYFCLPGKLFTDPTSTVLIDKDGKLLGAKIASDGQWRFPERTTVPEKFAKCIVQYEDRQFYNHPGFNPVSFGRALVQNVKSKRIVSGGSTLTMQVIRISRKNPPRNIWQKLIEVVLATRLELATTKEEVLALYASHAPFGSNVVGIDAASWRYFGRGPDKLSWAESATLAVLPNSPSLIYPGKNQQRLKEKRDRLLGRLCEAGIIDAATRDLSKEEPLPGAPHALPRLAPHLLDRAAKEGYNGAIVQSTLDAYLQERVNAVVEKHHRILKGNQVDNAAALVLDVETGNVLAYCGNTTDESDANGNDVDVITAPRSTGSILKPFLYAGMLSDGEILPNTLVADIPTDLSGYNPQNFNRSYDGAVPARRALARSLNVPAVRMLQHYRVEKFHGLLKNIGLTTIHRAPGEYGLSLILGGAEGKLWDLAGTYASMARTLNRYNETGVYDKRDFHPPMYLPGDTTEKYEAPVAEHSWFDASAIWFTFEAMAEVSRPDEEVNWTSFLTSHKVAWKTGTSFGFRDGWAIGVTPRYVVAVWVGNADGEGRPGLIGVQTAAPILFDIFSMLPASSWFRRPDNDLEKVMVCKESGCRATDICDKQEELIPKTGLKSAPCPYHRLVHLDASGQYRVTSDCESVSHMQHVPWFILPPSMEYYYKTKYPSYKLLPPYRNDCGGVITNAMDFVYPREETQLFIPVELDGRPGKIVFEIAHRRPGTVVYWHLDDHYAGSTTDIHQLAMNPEPGPHTVTCVDENGESIAMKFEIVNEKKK